MIVQTQQQQKKPSLCEQLHNCETQFDILRLLRELTAVFGYKYFFVANGATPEEKSFSEAIVITSAPSELVQGHEARQPVSSNPLIGILAETGAPLEFRLDNTAAPAPADFRSFLGEISGAYDVDCAFLVPVYHPDHGQSVVFFVGKRAPMEVCEIAELALHAHMVHDRLRQVSARPSKPDSPLTERERECLIWTSVGKTSIEFCAGFTCSSIPFSLLTFFISLN